MVCYPHKMTTDEYPTLIFMDLSGHSTPLPLGFSPQRGLAPLDELVQNSARFVQAIHDYELEQARKNGFIGNGNERRPAVGNGVPVKDPVVPRENSGPAEGDSQLRAKLTIIQEYEGPTGSEDSTRLLHYVDLYADVIHIGSMDCPPSGNLVTQVGYGNEIGIKLNRRVFFTVSREHALLRWNETRGRYSISDKGSSYGSRVNGHSRDLYKGQHISLPFQPSQEVTLGDNLEGNVKLLIQYPIKD